MLETILLISPLIIGAVVAAVNSDAITNTLDKFRAWLSRKREDYSQRPSKVSQYFLSPSFSSLLKVTEWTDSVQHKGLQAGIRIAAYLYLFAIIVVVALAAAYIILLIAVAILMIWLFLWLLGHMLGGGEVRETSRGIRLPREPYNLQVFGSTEKEKLEALFGEKDLEIEDDGTIYKPGFIREKVGFIDDQGRIYDTRGFANRTKIGHIAEDGSVKDW
jgi:hypothetical protein